MRKNKYMFLFIVVLFVILVSLIYILKCNFQNINNIKEETKLNISLARIEHSIKSNISSREVFKRNNAILIGENIKQLENNYYDIKICMNSQNITIDININKLWKEFNSDLYQEEYLNQLDKCISDILEIKLDNSKLKKYILDGYKLAKNESKNNENSKYSVNIDKYKLSGAIKDKEFIISIYE